MMLKRTFREEEDDNGSVFVPAPTSKKRLSFTDGSNNSSAAMGIARRTSSDFVANLEPLIRKVVSEEVARVIKVFFRESERQPIRNMGSSDERSFQLYFVNKLPNIIFTGNKIEAVDGTPLKIVLKDLKSQTSISYGSMSTIRIEILVLDGDFAADEEERWTDEEFNSNIIQEREGKRPLLTGELAITLKDGFGYLNDVSFTDNSSWTRSRRFRLGARVSHGPFRVMEAKSKAFVVKDHRGELYKKHHPPSLTDAVWRLEKIAKDGVFHRRLTSNGVHNVRDFLRLFNTDYTSLRNMLVGVTSTKIWGTIIEHAHECVIDDELHVYYSRGSTTLPTGLVFNSVYKVVGIIFEGTFFSINNLSPNEMVFVDTLKRHAYKNLKDVVKINDPSISKCQRALSLPSAEKTESITQSICGLQNSRFSISGPGEIEIRSVSDNSALASLYEPEKGNHRLHMSHTDQLIFGHPPAENMTTATDLSMYDDTFLEDFSGLNEQFLPNFVQESSDIWCSSQWVPDWDMGGGEGMLFQRGEAVTGLHSSSSSPSSCMTAVGSHGRKHQMRKKRRAGWCKIRAAVKWGICVRRDVAYKRLAHILFTC